MIAGSVYTYLPTEPNNMQLPAGEKKHATLLPRAEYEKEGVKYATCLDRAPALTLRTEEDAVVAEVRAKFVSAESRQAEREDLVAEFSYRFASDGVTITVGKLEKGIRFVLPLIERTGKIVTKSPFEKEQIFFLTGGFAAEEYTFSLGEEVTLKII